MAIDFSRLKQVSEVVRQNPKLARWLVNLGLILGIYWVTVTVTSWLAQPKLVEIMTMSPLEGGIAVAVQPAVRDTIAAKVTYTGSVLPYYRSDIRSRIQGWVEDVPVDEEAFVQKGQRLITLDRREAGARLSEARANLTFWEAERRRMERLFKEKAVSEFDWDNAQKQYAAAKAKVQEMETTYSYTGIDAPFSGWVARRFVDPGDMVNPGTVLLRLVDLRRVRVQAQVAGKDVDRIRAGTPAAVRLPALSGSVGPEKSPALTLSNPGNHSHGGVWAAAVTTVFPALDPVTRTATVEIVLDNPGARIKPHMYAVVDLILQRRENAVVVPREAVIEVDGKPVVFTTFGTAAEAKAVKTGITDGDRVEIVEGLGDGVMVIVEGNRNLVDGQQVNIVKFQ